MISLARLSLLWAVLTACSLMAQQGGGTLRGTVTDADFGSPVSGATIQLSGTGATSTSDSDGRFTFNAVPAGSYDLTLFREGYVRTRKDGVIVNSGAVRSIEIALTGEVVELDAFTIAPDALLEDSNTISAVNLAQSMDSMAIAINPGLLKAAGSTGNVGDAVKRLAGTAVVDSRYVVIRGLSDRYTAVVLNGARIPSSDPDRRAVNIDIFPTGLVDNVINSKTFTPDMPGESTGGHLNIITKKSPKEPFVNWSMSVGYNTLATGNDRFLTYRGGGVGMLGTAQERQLPAYLKGTTIEDLPIAPNGYDSPPDDSFDAPNQRISELRLRAARDLSARSMGVNVATAPENFGFSVIGGGQIDFAPGPVGLVAGLTYAKRYEVEQGLRGAVQLFSGKPGLVERMEFTKGEQSLLAGLLLGASIDFSDTDHLALTYFTNIAAEDEAVFQRGENQRVGTVDNGIPLDQENIVVFRENLTYTERRLQTWQVTGQHEFPDHGDIKLNWVAAYSMSSQDQPDVRNSLVAYDFVNGAYTSPGDAAPPNLERVWRVLNDTNYNVGVDVEIPWGDDPAEKERTKLKVGGSMDYSTRDYETQNFQYVDGTAGTFPPLTPTLTRVDPDDKNGQTLPDVIGDLDQRDRSESTFGGTTSYLDILFLSRARDIPPGEAYRGVQSIPSTYAMATFEITDELEFIAGARLEYTDLSVIAGGLVGEGITNQTASNFLSLDPETGLPIPAERLQRPSILRSDLLPAVSARWKFNEDFTVRAAISRTVARPTFKEIAPVFARDPETGDFFVGNVLLQMSDILNYDTRFEYAPQEGDQYALSFFAKQISNPIEYVNLGVFDTVRNDRAAALYGFEIEAAKKLENLTEELEGFSLGLNYSYIFSQVELRKSNEDIRRKAGLSTNRPLQGQPDYTFNATVSYDNEDLGVNAAILLNVTGSLLTQVGGDQGNALVPDVYQRPYTSLDASLTKKLWDDWKLNLRVSNLLNSRRERYYPNDLPASDLISGTTYSIGLSKEW